MSCLGVSEGIIRGGRRAQLVCTLLHTRRAREAKMQVSRVALSGWRRKHAANIPGLNGRKRLLECLGASVCASRRYAANGRAWTSTMRERG
jgi:hypothetical protein